MEDGRPTEVGFGYLVGTEGVIGPGAVQEDPVIAGLAYDHAVGGCLPWSNQHALRKLRRRLPVAVE